MSMVCSTEFRHVSRPNTVAVAGPLVRANSAAPLGSQLVQIQELPDSAGQLAGRVLRQELLCSGQHCHPETILIQAVAKHTITAFCCMEIERDAFARVGDADVSCTGVRRSSALASAYKVTPSRTSRLGVFQHCHLTVVTTSCHNSRMMALDITASNPTPSFSAICSNVAGQPISHIASNTDGWLDSAASRRNMSFTYRSSSSNCSAACRAPFTTS